MALRVPTKSLLKMNLDAAMLFAPFGCTPPPPPVPPFLLTQNLSPKDIAGSDIVKLESASRVLTRPLPNGTVPFVVWSENKMCP